MRNSGTYRRARRLAAKFDARLRGEQFTDYWRGSMWRYKDAVKLRPASPKPGKVYAPNGQRETARRLRQAEAM
jgi:hypothetical protein